MNQQRQDERTKCERCGTEYLEPVAECDWCPGVVPQPMQEEPAHG